MKRIYGGAMAFVGWLFSPLCWWDDLYVDIPLAYLFACLVGLVIHGHFLSSMILGYWIVNIVGLVMIHVGIRTASLKQTKMNISKGLLIPLSYTLLVTILYYIGWLRFPTDYHL